MATTEAPVDVDAHSYLQMMVADFLFLYISPVIILFGTAGNILSLVVLQSRHYKSSPTSIALSALALADIGVLNTGLLRHWFRSVSGTDIRHSGDIFCKIHMGLTYLTQVLSGNFLALTTIERVVSVWFPLRVREWITKKRMLIAVVMVTVFYLLCHIPLFLDIQLSAAYGYCGFSGLRFYRVWYWVDLTAYYLLPFAVILIGNALIIFGLRRAAHNRAKKFNHEDKGTSSTTVMLVVVGVVYMLTISPINILYLGYSYGAWSYDTPFEEAKYMLAYAITNQLVYVNSAINFLLYFFTGTKFRQAMGSVCRSLFAGKKQTSSRMINSTTSSSRMTK